MNWEKNKLLRGLNTFGINAEASYFTTITNLHDLEWAIKNKPAPFFILGGGSNVLLTTDLNAAVLCNRVPGIEITRYNDDEVHVAVGAGVPWHELVMWSVENEYGGIENLALIPGNVGAAPIQNIGAYGVEVASVIDAIEAFDLENGEMIRFPASVCEFGYRSSIFKSTYRNKLFLLRIHLRLSRHPVLQLEYGAIREELNRMGVDHPDVKAVSDAVIRIRKSKLPDPLLIGNAGSFFKNPVIDRTSYDHLLVTHPGMPSFPVDADRVKIPAAWLIDRLGWKGYRKGDAGVHIQHALVLVNYGKATGSEILQLAIEIQRSVDESFGIQLEPEVNIVG